MQGYEHRITWNGSSRYRASLRASHPNLDPRVISAALSLAPKHACRVGDRRRSPNGRPLPGHNEESRWSCQIADPDDLHSADDFVRALDAFLDRLAPARRFLLDLRAGGGRCDLFVGWFLGVFASLELRHDLLGKLADLGIELGVDIYAGERAENG